MYILSKWPYFGFKKKNVSGEVRERGFERVVLCKWVSEWTSCPAGDGFSFWKKWTEQSILSMKEEIRATFFPTCWMSFDVQSLVELVCSFADDFSSMDGLTFDGWLVLFFWYKKEKNIVCSFLTGGGVLFQLKREKSIYWILVKYFVGLRNAKCRKHTYVFL